MLLPPSPCGLRRDKAAYAGDRRKADGETEETESVQTREEKYRRRRVVDLGLRSLPFRSVWARRVRGRRLAYASAGRTPCRGEHFAHRRGDGFDRDRVDAA